jgi:hypothetical protein
MNLKTPRVTYFSQHTRAARSATARAETSSRSEKRAGAASFFASSSPSPARRASSFVGSVVVVFLASFSSSPSVSSSSGAGSGLFFRSLPALAPANPRGERTIDDHDAGDLATAPAARAGSRRGSRTRHGATRARGGAVDARARARNARSRAREALAREGAIAEWALLDWTNVFHPSFGFNI